MTTPEQPRPVSGIRIVGMLVVLVNLILTIALITQVRELQQRVASLPPDLASKTDVAMLRPLRIREIVTRNCVECHSARRLGATVSMEPTEIQRTIERMQAHPGANIPPGEFERIAASLLVLRCARCHGDAFEPDRVYDAVVEEISIIRHMLGQTDWQPRRIASVRTSDGQRITVGLTEESEPGTAIELFEQDTAPFGKAKK